MLCEGIKLSADKRGCMKWKHNFEGEYFYSLGSEANEPYRVVTCVCLFFILSAQ